jgi:putative peptide zinc metalloprotease protein
MLCRACHVHLRRGYPYCLHCGTLRRGVALESLDAPHLRRVDDPAQAVTLKAVTTIGRGSDNDWVIRDPSVSRHHARVVRGPDGFYIEDLNSFNGTTVGARVLQGDRAPLPDAAVIAIGDIEVRFEHPRSTAIGGKTVIHATEVTSALEEEQAPTATQPLNARLRRVGSWALKQIPDDRGRRVWVLRNTRGGNYLELDEGDAFIWQQIDGTTTVRDLLFAYAERYGELALPRIERALVTFSQAGLLAGLPDQARPGRLRRVGRFLLRVLLGLQLSIKGLDGGFGRIYRTFGWWFFTPAGVVALWLLIGAGAYGFWVATSRQRLFDVGGAAVYGALAIGVGYLLALVIHESAHALAVKSYGRRVTRAGFMLMMGMPFAFVDTSDMWFGTRWSRVVVALSGPLTTLGLAGGAGLAASYVPDPVVSGVCFHLAIGLYLNTLYNLNPLLPLDGYQAMADGLRMPKLREEAMAYFSGGLWRDLRAGRRPGLRQFGLALYGLLAIVGAALFFGLALLFWNSQLRQTIAEHVPAPLDTIVFVALLVLVTFPIWFRLGAAVARAVRRLRSSRHPAVGAPVEV